MKNLTITAACATALFLCGCGARDDKNKSANYPTYDTSRSVDNRNDTRNPEAINAEGDLRHNTDNDKDENNNSH